MDNSYIINKWNKEIYDDLVDDLIKLSDEKYKKFNSSLIPNIDKMLGIRVPMLRSIGKDISKGNYQEYFECCRDDYFEEIMLQGFVLNNIKADINDILKYMDKFIVKIDNWATCDTFCSGMKIIKKNKEAFYPYIQNLLSSKEPFTIRTGLILILSHYINDDYIDNIFQISNKVKNENYYVKMANAWLIATCYSKYRDKTLGFLHANQLDSWTFNKAIQKILESKTTAQEDKIELKKLKKS